MILQENDIYGLIGEEGFHRLVAAFYDRVPDDDILGPMYQASDMPAAEGRLRDFLIGRFGGPQRYIQTRGEPRLRMRHHPFKINQTARDRWMVLMTAALEETKLPPEVESLLRPYFNQTANFLINTVQPVALGLMQG